MRACRFSAGRCGGEPRRVDVRGVSCLALVVASHAVLTLRAGEGGGLILPALAKSAPTLPSPPRHPGTARCAACGCANRGCQWFFLRLPVWACGDSPLEAGGRATTSARSRRSPATRLRRQRVKKPFKTQAHTEPHGQGVSRPTISARSVRRTAHPLNGRRAKQRHPCNAVRAKQHHPNPNNQTDSQPGVIPETPLRRGQQETGYTASPCGPSVYEKPYAVHTV